MSASLHSKRLEARRKRERERRSAGGGTARQVAARKAGTAKWAAEKAGRAWTGCDPLPTDPQVGDAIVYQRVRDGQLQHQSYVVTGVRRDPLSGFGASGGRLELTFDTMDYEGNEGSGPTMVGRVANRFVAHARAGGYVPGSGLATVIATKPEAAAVGLFVDQYRKDLLEAGVVAIGPATEDQIMTAQLVIQDSLAQKNTAKDRCLEFAVRNGVFCLSGGQAMLVVPAALRRKIASIVGSAESK